MKIGVILFANISSHNNSTFALDCPSLEERVAFTMKLGVDWIATRPGIAVGVFGDAIVLLKLFALRERISAAFTV